MNKSKIIRIVTIAFYLLVLSFLLLYLRKLNFEEIANMHINYLYLFCAIIVGLLSRFFNASIWIQMLNDLKALQTKFVPLNYVFAKASLGRYIPGKVTWIAGRVFFANKLGIAKRKLAVSSIFESVLQVLVGFIFGGILILLFSSTDYIHPQMRNSLVLTTFFLSILMVPKVFNWFLDRSYRILKKRSLEEGDKISAKMLIKFTFYYVLRIISNGMMAVFIIQGLTPQLPLEHVPIILGTMGLAASAGIAAIFAPSGIGVRDGVQLVLFNTIMLSEVALIAVVLVRLTSVIVDFSFFGISYLLTKVVRNE